MVSSSKQISYKIHTQYIYKVRTVYIVYSLRSIYVVYTVYKLFTNSVNQLIYTEQLAIENPKKL